MENDIGKSTTEEMWSDLAYLRKELENFCDKYKVRISAESYRGDGRYYDGTPEKSRVAIKMWGIIK